MYIPVYIHIYIYFLLYLYIYIFIYVYIYICIYLCMIYIYIYIIYSKTHIYIYIYILLGFGDQGAGCMVTEDSNTQCRTLELLINLVTKSSSELRYKWAEEMTQSHHFQKLMQMVMRSGERRIKFLYEKLLNNVLTRCDQQKLMNT